MEWMHGKCLEEYKLTNMVLPDTQNEWVNDTSNVSLHPGKSTSIFHNTIHYLLHYDVTMEYHRWTQGYTVPY